MQRVAVITGGSQGLGRALAEALARDGWRVVVDARRADRLGPVVDALGPDVVGIAGDVTDPDHRAAVLAAAGHRIDLLVNNASTLGASPLPALADLDLDVLRHAFEVNVVAPVALVQDAGSRLGEGATVVNVTSDAAVEGYPTWGAYGATKAALDQASAVLAAERPTLRVLSVDPGDMRTEMHQDAFAGEDISDRPEPATRVPPLLRLVEGERVSGRYRLDDLVDEGPGR